MTRTSLPYRVSFIKKFRLYLRCNSTKNERSGPRPSARHGAFVSPAGPNTAQESSQLPPTRSPSRPRHPHLSPAHAAEELGDLLEAARQIAIESAGGEPDDAPGIDHVGRIEVPPADILAEKPERPLLPKEGEVHLHHQVAGAHEEPALQLSPLPLPESVPEPLLGRAPDDEVVDVAGGEEAIARGAEEGDPARTPRDDGGLEAVDPREPEQVIEIVGGRMRGLLGDDLAAREGEHLLDIPPELDRPRKAVADAAITYPVAIDNDYRIWRAFANSYWPAHYLIDADGRIRYHHFGQGNYAGTEQAIQGLLREAGGKTASNALVKPQARGAEAGPDLANIRSGETYLGYERTTGFVSPGGLAADGARSYTIRDHEF